jgi:hypothetical protein
MNGFGFVAGEFHPNFRRSARIARLHRHADLEIW